MSPDELEGSGQSAKEVAGLVPGETTKVVDPSDQASATLKDWQLSGALHDCTAGWKTLLDKLSTDMDSYGTKMIKMAQEYRGTDHGVAAKLNAIGTQSAPGPAPAAAGPDPFGTTVHGGHALQAV
ncbi:hypothetical protein [Streptomyces sp. CB03911]|uniref:hypothetical protein n=1 Tax=Streptomycetaceae TaxID=2062 RepID=UPI000939C7C0|nr:hypothetical protein [Streptomyces sp. CB03911]OKI19882.1 hypothetical protein A6A07_37820 [Streptomyces sp. CB03911]